MDWSQPNAKLGAAWVVLSAAVALHVTDEALTDFLSVYNPSVVALRQELGWWPMPTFTFGFWLGGLIGLVIVLFLLSPFMFRGARWMRPIAYFLIAIMILNAAGHTAGTIFGRTVESVRFARPAPGFYSSPFLLAASIYLLVQLRRTKKSTAGKAATVST
jgi:hypothetical protein